MRMMSAVLIAVLSASSLFAQEPPPFSESIDVNIANVDVFVTDAAGKRTAHGRTVEKDRTTTLSELTGDPATLESGAVCGRGGAAARRVRSHPGDGDGE